MSSERHGPTPDFEAAGLLNGLAGPAREARLRLLDRLFQAGIDIEDLKTAAADDRLVILPAEHALGSDTRYSTREVSERVGVPLDYLLAIRRAQGLAAAEPEEPAYSERDLEALRIMAGFYEAGFDRQGMLEVARVLGRAMAQVADSLGHQAVSQAMLEAGQLPGAREVAVAFVDMVAFTRLGESLPPAEVGAIAGRLAELAGECASPPCGS